MYQIKTHDHSVSGRPKEFVLPEVAELEGLFFILYPTHGESIEYHLKKHQIIWFDPATKKQQKADYRATSIRDGIYFIDYILDGQSISMILDLINQTFTEVVAHLSSLPNPNTSKQIQLNIATMDLSITQGSLDKPYEKYQDLHSQTDELIGARFLYYCGFDTVYEHIYLNQNYYTWHCLVGERTGLADTNPCHYYKIADKLYLLIWTRKSSPYMGLMLIDTNFLRADGKVYGYQTSTANKQINLPISPYFSIINKPNVPYGMLLENIKNDFS
ncbi:molybdenum cofactor biosynthesis F family protein [Entomomonas sp. E2T0]|uniref:molybdenum cofactor biosynthesis F family protein n=1 Tax=Entomomonas sp. E2T0 TaxID=2930213 RepID=UPI0022281FA0|nr:molybdenum cofactor biosynthesis F family protein [Entomomonas sp. E2T0]UYZ85222.1 molybdenum cofactor biosynthesis F family protein [Entomomonas sp. E2T0]